MSSLGKERADYEEALKKIVAYDWTNKFQSTTSYGKCLVCHFDVSNHSALCPIYIAEKVLDKYK